MLAGRGHQVVRRELVEQFHIGDQPRAGEDAFEQVVAQERVLRDQIRHGLIEHVQVVDPLAGVAALAEEVLVDVGNG